MTVEDPVGDGSGVWEDGSGYQLILDANNSPADDFLVPECGDSYDFSFTIPAGASANDQTTVVTGSQQITVPAGTYFYDLFNPGCEEYGDMYVPNGDCNDPSYGNDFVIEAGKTYTFALSQIEEDGYLNDCVTITVTNTTTGIAENETTGVSIFPNPATTVLNVNAEGYNTVEIVNLLGQVVYGANAESNMQINVEDLANGTYFVRLNGVNGTTTQKFIKK